MCMSPSYDDEFGARVCKMQKKVYVNGKNREQMSAFGFNIAYKIGVKGYFLDGNFFF